MPENNLVGRVIDGRFPLLEAIQSSYAGEAYRTQLAGAQPQRAALLLVPASEDQASAWKLAGSFSHPHLQRIFAGGRAEVDGRNLLYLVVELPEESLSQILPERPLTVDETAEMLPPILDALAALHAGGAVHAAVRPAQVLVVGDKVKLSIAPVRAAGSTLPSAPMDPHDAPEAGKGSFAPAADVWSLGATLVEALTQHIPDADTALPAGISAPFDAIARRCLQADPARRGSIDEIRRLLQPPAARPPVQPAVVASAVEPVVAADPRPAARPTPKAEPLILPDRPSPAREVPQRTPNLTPLYITCGAFALILLLVVIFHRHKPAPTPTPVPAASTSPSSSPLPVTPGGHARGAVANRVMPDIPERASRSIHGTINVAIRVNVNDSGAVTSAEIESRNRSRYFTDQALNAARRWTFSPPQSNGKPVNSTWSLRFQFRRDQAASVQPVQVNP